MRTLPFTLDPEELAALCRTHRIATLSLFGSILRDDFRPDSDIDILITFDEGTTLTLDSYLDITDALSPLFAGRTIDLVEEARLTDPYRRPHILQTCEPLYAR